MGIITITSDWGENDHYAAAVKAKIYGYFPQAQVVDITHLVPVFDIGKAAYFLRNVYPFAPPQSVHIVGVNSIADKNSAHLIVCFHDQFFVGTDNGIFSLLFPQNEMPSEVYEITEMQDNDSFTFPSRDLFAKIAAKLASGIPPQDLGKPAQILRKITPSFPTVRHEKTSDNQILYTEIVGEVAYIDRYENVNTNIHQNLFNQWKAQFPNFEISFVGSSESVSKISTAYADVNLASIVALFTSDGHLQIALNQAPAARLLGINKRTQIIVRFKN